MRHYVRTLLIIFVLVLSVFPTAVLADDTVDRQVQLQNEINDLKSKISDLQGQQKTLASALAYINSKKALTQKQIEITQVEIDVLQHDIESISGKISVLEDSLNLLTTALMNEVRTGYKRQNVNGFDLLFSSGNFSDIMNAYNYIQVAQEQHQQLLQRTTQAKLTYDDQKTAKEDKQQTVQKLQKQLLVQKQDLLNQEVAKQKLLSDTKSSESNYQRLLTQAEAELNSFRSFTSSKGGGLLPPQNSPDGWYFSQRDQRWGNMCIGNSCLTSSPDTIEAVGCLVSSVAMVKKKYGEDVTPATIAANSSYFVLNTGSMNRPWPAPNGYSYAYLGRDMGRVDNELKDGKPVIVKLSVRTNTVGTHFIVLKSGSNGDYMMHDPWEGYDKKFSDFYNTNQIIAIGVLQKN